MQGLDIRLLNEEKAEMLFQSRYKGEFTFAFDDISDSRIIEEKLSLAREYTQKGMRLYVFCGFDRVNRYDKSFWERDIFDVFRRIEILMKYKALPYITRFEKYADSPYRGMYITLARWCNQPNIFRKKSFREMFTDENGSARRYAEEFEAKIPSITPYYDMKFEV